MHFLAAFVATVVFAASAQGQRVTAMLDQPFALAPGRSVTIEAERLQIGFERVVSDSRCPRGAQCITEGEAVVRVWLLKAPAARETRELKTTPTETSVVYGAYRVNLKALDPVPTTDHDIRPSEYVAPLVISRTPRGGNGP
jgi:hypothetical protein